VVENLDRSTVAVSIGDRGGVSTHWYVDMVRVTSTEIVFPSLSASWGGHEDGHSVAVAGERGQVTQFHVPWSRPGPAPGTVDMVLALAAIHGANASWVGSMSLTSVIFRPMASDVTGSRP
jgi:hypothetical protein